MKKLFKALALPGILFLCISCSGTDPDGTGGKGDTEKPGVETPADENPSAQTGNIRFFNESSYTVIIHQDAFSGPVLLELGAGQSKQVQARVSANYGVGSTFPAEYQYRVAEGTDLASGDVWAKGIDPNVQLNVVVEAGKSYTLQIPQPKNLEFTAAFVRILNASDMQAELRYLGTAFKQTGNGNLPVPVGKTGVYEFPSTAAGKTMSGYTVHSTFQSAAVPDFIAKNSVIYDFTYNGTSAVKTGEHIIAF
jgi:hypothetical protein